MTRFSFKTGLNLLAILMVAGLSASCIVVTDSHYYGTVYRDIALNDSLAPYGVCSGSVPFSGMIDPTCGALERSADEWVAMPCAVYDRFGHDVYDYTVSWHFLPGFIQEVCHGTTLIVISSETPGQSYLEISDQDPRTKLNFSAISFERFQEIRNQSLLAPAVIHTAVPTTGVIELPAPTGAVAPTGAAGATGSTK